MYRGMWRKAVADTRTHRLQSALIVVILIAASTALALSLIVQQNADKPWRKAFDRANGAHLTFFGGGSADLSPLASIEGVSDAAGPYPMVLDAALITGGTKHETRVAGVDDDPYTVGQQLLVDGRWLGADSTGEIVLERSYADYLNVEVGETVQFKAGDAFPFFTVVGTAIDTSRGKYPDWTPGHAWVLEESLAIIEPDAARIGSVLMIRLNQPDEAEEFVGRALNGQVARGQVRVVDWTSVQEDMNEWNRINSVFLGVFSAFGLLAAGLIIANVIGGRVLAQFREIGILKTIGFTPRQVAGIYLVQHLALALVSSVIGLGLSVLIAPIYLRQLAESYNTETGSSFDPLVYMIAVVAILFAVALFTLLPAWRGGRVSTVRAITTGFTAVGTRPSALAQLARRLRLPVQIGVGVKDSFARPWRAVLTIAALSLTIITITFTLGMEAMFDRIVVDRGLVEEPWDIEVRRDDGSDSEIRAALDEHPDVSSYATSNWLRGELAASGGRAAAPFELRALGADVENADYPMIDGRMFKMPGEAIIGRTLFEELGLNIGDQIELEAVMGSFSNPTRAPLMLTIVGTYVEPEEDGRVVLFPFESAAEIFPGIVPETYEVMMRDGGDWDGLIAAVQIATNYGVDIDQSERGMPGQLKTIRSIMFGLSGLLLIIGVANMLTTTLLNVRERTRDIGILKALGMTPRQITGSVASGVVLLTLLGTVAGIPLGLLVYRGLFIVVAENMVDADPKLYTAPSALGVALIVPFALVFAALTSVVPGRRAAQLPVTDVLRDE